MRCIETWHSLTIIYIFFCDKLQHEMYWNQNKTAVWSSAIVDKLQHEMYWNTIKIPEPETNAVG